VAVFLAAPAFAREYFIINREGSGAGTRDDPFGMADLPSTSDTSDLGRAIRSLQPGDTLSFLAGDYRIIKAAGNHYWLGYIRPPCRATPDKRITFRAMPGQNVRLVHAGGGTQPMFGAYAYITIQRFHVDGDPCPLARIGGTGVEIGYCHYKGQHVNIKDNHDGLRMENGSKLWIHHNIFEGVTGLNTGSCGIKLYRTNDCVIEDNYIHGCTVGISDKDGARTTPIAGTCSLITSDWASMANCKGERLATSSTTTFWTGPSRCAPGPTGQRYTTTSFERTN